MKTHPHFSLHGQTALVTATGQTMVVDGGNCLQEEKGPYLMNTNSDSTKSEVSLKVLETERLILRQFSDDDAPFILELLNDPSFIQNIGDRKIRSLAGAKIYLKNGPVASYAQHGFGLYLVELKKTGESIGMCGLIKRPGLDDVDIGYAFLPKFWSRGYALESALGVKHYARDAIGLKRMVAITNPDNFPSIRVLEKIGMTFEKMIQLPNDEMELKLFAVEL